jgi:formylglycine-generating enzyme required for sulfatase activity
MNFSPSRAPVLRALSVLVACAAVTAGCTAVLGADFDRGAMPDDAGDGSADASPSQVDPGARADAASDGGATPQCPAPAGRPGVRVSAEAGTWCIDSTEVTRADYGVFVASTDPGSSPQPSFCSWNGSFIPQEGWTDSPHDDRPVTKVSWCDAYMYCAWAGKRLCGEPSDGVACGSADEGTDLVLSCPAGRIIVFVAFASFGTPTGSCATYEKGACDSKTSWSVVTSACVGQSSCTIRPSSNDFGDPCAGVKKSLSVRALCGTHGGGGDPHNQWGAVCTRDDAYAFPYGNVYDPSRCIGADVDAAGPAPVTSAPRCEGGYPGVVGMSGNVMEWVDGCGDPSDAGPAHDICAFRGGGYASQGQDMRCGSTWISDRQDTWPDVGFRCCSRE